MKLISFVLTLALTGFSTSALAAGVVTANPETNAMDELDPFAPNIQDVLKNMDQDYQESTGQSPQLQLNIGDSVTPQFYGGCYRLSCAVYIRVIKDRQEAYLYENGQLTYTWDVSTGAPGHGTPDFDTHPEGRIYDSYTSKKYPGGDYNGLGNMPYAVFIEGGFAIHGTGRGNWQYLGSRASHGCIRLHPDNARYFNRLVRANGIYNTWITVE